MNSNILVITNNFQSSLTYTRMLAGYGYAVNEATTLTGARVRLRAKLIPAIIIMDMKHHEADQIDFIEMITAEYTNIRIIHIGATQIAGHNVTHLNRPVQPETILDTVKQLEYV